MAKRTVKTRVVSEPVPEQVALPEQPVEIQPAASAADLLDTPSRASVVICPNCGGRGAYEGGDGDQCASCDGQGEIMAMGRVILSGPRSVADEIKTMCDLGLLPPEQIPATLVDDPPAADTPVTVTLNNGWTLTTSVSILTPEQQAEATYQRKLESAKNEHLEASLQVERIRGELKAAKDRQKQAIELYQEIELRGPVVPQPVTPPGEQSGTMQPLASDSNQADGESAWRSIPLTELSLDTIRGLGDTKRDALLDACPTLGAFVDKQVEAGASGVDTVLPKGIGKAITDPLEEMLLDYLAKWRANQSADDTGAEMAGVSGSTCVETHSAPTPAVPLVPSFSDWESMTTEQQHDYINARAAQISEGLPPAESITMTADVQAGNIAYGRGERVTDCPRIPGDEMDSWLAGYFDAARGDDSQAREDVQRLDAILDKAEYDSEPEPELAAEIAEDKAVLAFSLDDI